jgi:hypothetical protein
MAEHRDAGLHFDKTTFAFRQLDPALQKKSCERLHMSAAQPGTRPEN